jgi:hypothetical protein
MAATKIYVARHGFSTVHAGEKVIVYQGDTVEAGHWLIANSPDSFEPLVIKHQVTAEAKTLTTADKAAADKAAAELAAAAKAAEAAKATA